MTLTPTLGTIALAVAQLPTSVSTGVRGFLGGVALVVLGAWTWRRIAGRNNDPRSRLSVESDTGYAGFLISGSYAVAAVAASLVYLWKDTFMSNPVLLAVPAGVVLLHWYFEEAEDD